MNKTPVNKTPVNGRSPRTSKKAAPLDGVALVTSGVSVIEIDRDDDIGSIRQKLELADTNQIALFVPHAPRDLYNPVRVKLLRRYARASAKDMVVVARDGQLRRLAREEGLPVAGSLKNIEKRFPTTRRRGFDLSGLSAGVSILSSTIVVLAIVLAGLLGIVFLVPSATVEIAPAASPAEEVIVVRASKQAKGVDVDKREIGARTVTVDVEASDSIPTTGKRTNDGGRAKGRVTFTNTGANPVTIPRGAQVRTIGDVRFVTDAEATVDRGRSETVAVTALDAGTIGNVDANQIRNFVDSGLAGTAGLSVTNAQKTEGGTQTAGTFVTAADRTRLLAQVTDKLREAGYARLYETKGDSESIYRDGVNVTISEQRFSDFVDASAETLSINVTAKATALAFDSKNLFDLGARYARTKIPPSQQVLPNSIEMAPLGITAIDDTAVSFQVMLKYKVVPTVDEDEVRSAIAGRSVDEANGYLQSRYQLVRPPSIAISPGIFTTLPRLSGRILLKLVS